MLDNLKLQPIENWLKKNIEICKLTKPKQKLCF